MKSERNALRDYMLWSSPELAERVRQRPAARKRNSGFSNSAIPKVLATVSVDPAVTHILPRANWMDDSTPIVEPAIPQFLGMLDKKGERATRLDLANWLISRDNPLTARAFVNRTWREFFGIGIIQSRWTTSARRANGRRMRNCSIGWPANSCIRSPAPPALTIGMCVTSSG